MAMTFGRSNRYRGEGRSVFTWVVAHIAQAIRRELAYRRTTRALNRLDDRALEDVGVMRTSVGYELISKRGRP